jgi:ferredoxin--NADP+ reductase
MSINNEVKNRFRLKLIEKIIHDYETISFDFECTEITTWTAGDSTKLYVRVHDQPIGKKFSFATIPSESKVRFTTRIRSQRSAYKEQLDQLNPGDYLEISKPQGAFGLRRENRPIILLSNGVGIAASRSLIKAFEVNQEAIPQITQLNVDASGAIFRDDLKAVENQVQSFKSIYTSDRTSFYRQLEKLIRIAKENDSVVPYFYVVGSNAFVNGVTEFIVDHSYRYDDIIMDRQVADEETCACGKQAVCGCPEPIALEYDEEDILAITFATKAS